VARLLNRWGRRIGVLQSLHIEYPVGRSGTRFCALIAREPFASLDSSRLRYFLVEDDGGSHYPAMIDAVCPWPGDDTLTSICGVVVAGG
jgi:hypothetical protein